MCSIVLAQISDISEATELTLSADLTIPKNGGIFMSDDAVLTVPAGKTLTNKGSICLYDNARLSIIEAGAEFVNEGWVYADQTSKVSVAGRFTVAENGDSQIGVKKLGMHRRTEHGQRLFLPVRRRRELYSSWKRRSSRVRIP